MYNCVECGEEVTNGFCHEESGDVVCSAECGGKYLEAFGEQADELDLFWPCFEG